MRVAVLSIFIVFICSFGYSSQIPEWFLNSTAVYPNELFITGLGESTSRDSAQAAALSEIALFFNSRVAVQSVATRSFTDDLTNQTYRETYDDVVNIGSQAEFFGASFQTWYNEQTGRWHVIAYLNRNETLRVFESKLSAETNILSDVTSKLNTTQNMVERMSLYQRGIAAGNAMLTYINYITVLDSSRNYEQARNDIHRLELAYRNERQRASFSFAPTQAPARINNALKGLFEDNGYVVRPRDGLFTIETTINMDEEELPAGIFMRSNITILINQGKENIFTYTKTLPRYGHRTHSGAVTKNYLEIERDLEENFIKAFRETVGI